MFGGIGSEDGNKFVKKEKSQRKEEGQVLTGLYILSIILIAMGIILLVIFSPGPNTYLADLVCLLIGLGTILLLVAFAQSMFSEAMDPFLKKREENMSGGTGSEDRVEKKTVETKKFEPKKPLK